MCTCRMKRQNVKKPCVSARENATSRTERKEDLNLMIIQNNPDIIPDKGRILLSIMCPSKEGVQSHQASKNRVRASFYVSNPPHFDLRFHCIYFLFTFFYGLTNQNSKYISSKLNPKQLKNLLIHKVQKLFRSIDLNLFSCEKFTQ